MQPPPPTAVIYVLTGHDVFNVAEVLRGVGAVAMDAGATVVATTRVPPRSEALEKHPRSGLIVTPGPDETWPDISAWHDATVGLYSHSFPPSVARVTPDDEVVGTMAAEHLCDRGYRRLLYYGVRQPWSVLRCRGFTGTAQRLGIEPMCLIAPSWDELKDVGRLRSLHEYLTGEPVGVFAGNDCIAEILRDSIAGAGRDIPGDVGLLGVDNFELCSAYGWIPISSIDLNSRRIGEVAATLLLDILAGAAEPGTHLTVLPRGVVARRSTDARLVRDRDVAEAIRLLTHDCGSSISVDELAQRVGLSRTTLDRRFKECLGRTVADEAIRLRLMLARRRLESTDLPLSRVAREAGFKHLSNFSTAFRRYFGKSPSRWRQEIRGRSATRRPA